MTEKKRAAKRGQFAPKHVFKIVWATDKPSDGCMVDPDGRYELYAGDVVQFHNTIDVDAIIPSTCQDLFVESLPIVIPANDGRGNLTRSESAPSGEYLCRPECDHSGGGPRFVPKP